MTIRWNSIVETILFDLTKYMLSYFLVNCYDGIELKENSPERWRWRWQARFLRILLKIGCRIFLANIQKLRFYVQLLPIRFDASVRPSVRQSVSSSVRQSVSSSVRQSVRSSVRQSVSPSVRQSVRSSVRQSVSPSVRPSVSPSVRQSVSPSVRQSVRQSVRPSVRPSVNVYSIRTRCWRFCVLIPFECCIYVRSGL